MKWWGNAWFGLCLATLLASPSAAQFQTSGGFEQDSSLPVEIASDSLKVDQEAGKAVFSGNVTVAQGALRMAAEAVEVTYSDADAGRGIERIEASGGVTLTNGTEAAEGQTAFYSVSDSKIDMSGNVLLTQGPNAVAGDKLAIDLETGVANMEGRVRTVILPEATE